MGRLQCQANEPNSRDWASTAYVRRLRYGENRLPAALLRLAIQSASVSSRLQTRPTAFSPSFMERQSKRRRRPALSCIECRRRKIKCDRNDPCTHCISVRIQCTFNVYGDEPVSRQQPQQDTASGLSVLVPTHGPMAERGNQLLTAATSPSDQAWHIGANRPTTERGNHLCRPRAAAAAAARHNDAPNTLGGDDIRSLNRAQDVQLDIRDLLQRVQKLEGSSAASPNRALPKTSRDTCERPSRLHESEIVLDKSRSFGRSHPVKMPQEVQSASMGQSMASTAFC